MEADIIYECKKISYEYSFGNLKQTALNDIDLSINRGDFLCLCGPSGSGKSTLLNLLGLIEPVQGGRIFFEKIDLGHLSEHKKNSIRRYRLGFVFQTFNLINILSAYENVEYFLTRQGLSKKERAERVCEALESVKLQDHMHKRPLEMSGGQRQRVAIARALAKKPHVIIADEPTASLDQKNGHEVMELLGNLSKNEQITVILASHDPMVIQMSERVVRLQDGAII